MRLLIAAGPVATIERLKTVLEEFSRLESNVYTNCDDPPMRCLEINHPDLMNLDPHGPEGELNDWPSANRGKDQSLRVAVMKDLASTPDPTKWPSVESGTTFDKSTEFDFLIAHIRRLAETLEALSKASRMSPV